MEWGGGPGKSKKNAGNARKRGKSEGRIADTNKGTRLKGTIKKKGKKQYRQDVF